MTRPWQRAIPWSTAVAAVLACQPLQALQNAYARAATASPGMAFLVVEWNDLKDTETVYDALVGNPGSTVETSYDWFCIAIDLNSTTDSVAWAHRLPTWEAGWVGGMRAAGDGAVTVVSIRFPPDRGRYYQRWQISRDGVRSAGPDIHMDPADKQYLSHSGDLYRVRDGQCFVRHGALAEEQPVAASALALATILEASTRPYGLPSTVPGTLCVLEGGSAEHTYRLIPVGPDVPPLPAPRTVPADVCFRARVVVGPPEWPVLVGCDRSTTQAKCMDLTNGNVYEVLAGSRCFNAAAAAAYVADGELHILAMTDPEATRTGLLRARTVSFDMEELVLPSGRRTKRHIVLRCNTIRKVAPTPE